jgi:hypothetical protein
MMRLSYNCLYDGAVSRAGGEYQGRPASGRAIARERTAGNCHRCGEGGRRYPYSTAPSLIHCSTYGFAGPWRARDRSCTTRGGRGREEPAEYREEGGGWEGSAAPPASYSERSRRSVLSPGARSRPWREEGLVLLRSIPAEYGASTLRIVHRRKTPWGAAGWNWLLFPDLNSVRIQTTELETRIPISKFQVQFTTSKHSVNVSPTCATILSLTTTHGGSARRKRWR